MKILTFAFFYAIYIGLLFTSSFYFHQQDVALFSVVNAIILLFISLLLYLKTSGKIKTDYKKEKLIYLTLAFIGIYITVYVRGSFSTFFGLLKIGSGIQILVLLVTSILIFNVRIIEWLKTLISRNSSHRP